MPQTESTKAQQLYQEAEQYHEEIARDCSFLEEARMIYPIDFNQLSTKNSLHNKKCNPTGSLLTLQLVKKEQEMIR